MGKSCIKSAVVRTKAVRSAFDTIAWIGLSQKANVLLLQKRLFLHLTEQHLGQKLSTEQQYEALQKVAMGKNLLVVLDDCWHTEHFKMLNIVDVETSSRILVSSRISGLIKNSTEVKLALMTTEEAVEMLAHGCGLDAQEVPAELIEVVGLCGRLPLCLNIAAQIIADCGENWAEDVLPTMRNGMSQLMDDSAAGGGGGGLSVQESISKCNFNHYYTTTRAHKPCFCSPVVASMDSITGKGSTETKQLFLDSAIFAEDQRIPRKVFGVLHAASLANSDLTANTKDHALILIKRRVSTLVKRSLFLEVVRGSISIHDIVVSCRD